MHPRDVALERKACKAYVLLQLVARFVARIATESMLAADDTPPFTRDLRLIASAIAKDSKARTKHAAVAIGSRVRCLWCLRSSASVECLNNFNCGHAGGHALWRAGDLTICAKCGAHSQF